MAGERSVAAEGRDYGQHEAFRGTRLAAVENRAARADADVVRRRRARQGRHPKEVAFAFNGSAKGVEARDGGFDVL